VSEFRFAEPDWAYALWGVLVFVGLLFWLERRGGGALDRLVSATLRPRLVAGPGPRTRRLRVLLVGLALGFLVVALMRPQWGLRTVATPRVGAEIMVLLDVSRSMLAEDVAPNRLERAKAEITDLLAFLDGDPVGLVGFAGRATVLSPLTPDFGFLRLVLDGVGPHSVSRGGTRIGDAIRTGVAGFGPAGDASRAILLITDGEDHESFPLDAAKAAAEAGVRIIAIGFGDEAGSEIWVTDRRTGARTRLLDGDGRPVRSRLDGDLLREVALVTEGAYVPAGTGVLDLASIYERHIARLMRGKLDGRGRTVRDEGYQWAVLLALVLLVSSVAVGSGVGARGDASRTLARATLVLLAVTIGATSGRAEEVPEDEAVPEAVAPPPEAAPEAEAEPEDPRSVYNRGVTQLARSDPDEAERWFRRARREAGADGRVRVDAAYNLGWTFVQRGESIESTEPKEALALYHQAADWFRDAVSQNPDDSEARHNLEVVLRRALLLSDQLAREGEAGFDRSLREIAERQRELVMESARLLERVDESSDLNAEDRLRREFRGLTTTERMILSDADRLAGEIGAERDALEARPEEERSPEDAMRAAQLGNVLHYLHRARERMGQARRQLRQRQPERGYRRASAALTELKRALDQFRDPVSMLDTLIREVAALGASTALLAASRSEIPGLEETPEVPAWLTPGSLQEDQAFVAERTEELGLRLRAGLEPDVPPDADPGTARLVEAAREAEPLVMTARTQLRQAAEALGGEDLGGAQQAQLDGLTALLEARERFLDLRGLVEAVYADEKGIETIVTADEENAEEVLQEYRAGLLDAQRKNLRRSERLKQMIEAEKSALDAAGADPADEATAAQARRLSVAGELLSRARTEMDAVEKHLDTPDWPHVRTSSERAVQHLEGLRRLFFSIVEHLREVAERQIDLTDETQDAAALAEDSAPSLKERVGPLVPTQRDLASRSEAIALALEDQSRQEGDALTGEGDAAETTRRLRLAAEHVLAAEAEMTTAAGGMDADPPELDGALETQKTALVELGKALALLVPPEQRQGESPDSEPSGEDDAAQRGENEPPDEGESMDPAQLLQSVRDREAQRRRERSGKENAGYETVEKDW
jgi:Ca-activated chloride channel family protein